MTEFMSKSRVNLLVYSPEPFEFVEFESVPEGMSQVRKLRHEVS